MYKWERKSQTQYICSLDTPVGVSVINKYRDLLELYSPWRLKTYQKRKMLRGHLALLHLKTV